MLKILAIFVFFISFYRIPLFNPNYYISLVFGLFVFFSILQRLPEKINLFVSFSGNTIAIILAVFFFYFLAIDLAGSLKFDNASNSFFIRLISFFFLSVFPAYFIYNNCKVDSKKKIIDVIFLSFLLQLFIWVVTYVDPSLKTAIYSLMGNKDSVNLYDYNMGSRGFGMSKEINYTTPYLMVLISLILVKNNYLSLVTLPTQIINSNMAIIASFIGLFFSNLKFSYKLIIVFLSIIFITYFGEEVFSRLYSELDAGGYRTIDALFGRHFFALNTGIFEHMFGAGIYVFQNGAERSSDMGWVIMYNYGGAFFVILFLIYLAVSSFLISGKSFFSLAWFASGVLLNTKGLLFGPNAYVFMTVLLSFFSYNKKLKW
jgi:hypothetical protein